MFEIVGKYQYTSVYPKAYDFATDDYGVDLGYAGILCSDGSMFRILIHRGYYILTNIDSLYVQTCGAYLMLCSNKKDDHRLKSVLIMRG